MMRTSRLAEQRGKASRQDRVGVPRVMHGPENILCNTYN